LKFKTNTLKNLLLPLPQPKDRDTPGLVHR
jgi:hypothetical protein